MATLSLCMIVKNEEDVLARCLESARAAVDEIIIVDTGSSDQTRRIARQFTEKVYDFEWIDDFAAARNFSFSKATMDYCLWLDADDILRAEDCRALCALKKTLPPETDLVMMRYHTAFDAAGNPTFSYYRERLIRRDAGFLWEGAVHEAIVPAGNILYSEIAVTHRKLHPADPDRNLRIYEKELRAGRALSPRDQFYYARELFYHARYREAESCLVKLLENGAGWIENLLEACRLLADCRDRLGDRSGALRALLQSLMFCAPRAEICCDLGARFFEENDYETAAFWYETALSRPREDRSGGFILPDCYGYIPALQLCLCRYYQGRLEEAARWNERAGEYKPESAAVAQNRQFFQSRLEAK